MHRRAGLLASFALASSAFACNAATTSLDGGVSDAGDGGMKPVWVPEPGIPVHEDFFGVWGRNRNDIFIVGWAGTIIHYDGMSWTKQTVTSTQPITAIHGFAPDDPMMPTAPLFAVGWHGTILSYTNGMWVDVTKTTTNTNDLFGVRISSANNAIAVGDHGRLLGWTPMKNWKIVSLAVPGEFSGMLITPQGVLKGIWNDGDSYYISGSGGAAYRSSGGFMSFELLDTRVDQALRGVWGIPGGEVYTVGLGGLILRFDRTNQIWRRVQNNGADELPTQFFFDIFGLSGDDITIVGWGGTAVRFVGGNWITEPTGTTEDLRAVWIDNMTQVAFAVGANGTVLRRDPPPPDDGGMPVGADN